MNAFQRHWLAAWQYIGRRLWRIFVICFVAFLAASVGFYFICRANPEWTATLFAQLSANIQNDLFGISPVMDFLRILWNNLLVSAVYIAMGFFPFLFAPAAPLLLNACSIGLIGAIYERMGISAVTFFAGILPHGILEIPAIALALACGFAICRSFTRYTLHRALPGECREAMAGALRTYLMVCLPLFLVAAAVEAFLTPAVLQFFM